MQPPPQRGMQADQQHGMQGRMQNAMQPPPQRDMQHAPQHGMQGDTQTVVHRTPQSGVCHVAHGGMQTRGANRFQALADDEEWDEDGIPEATSAHCAADLVEKRPEPQRP